jgi:hypothetical protein
LITASAVGPDAGAGVAGDAFGVLRGRPVLVVGQVQLGHGPTGLDQALVEQLRVATPHVPQQPPVAIAVLHIALEPHGRPRRHEAPDVAGGAGGTTLVTGLGSIDLQEANGVVLAADPHADGVAIGDRRDDCGLSVRRDP